VVGVRELQALRCQTIDVARRLEPGSLTLYEAEQALHEVNALKNSAAVIEIMLAKRIADTGEWKRKGHRSPAEHHAASTGTSPSRAKDALETADRLAGQPHLSEAAKAGELSPEQTSRISDAAAANPTSESDLVEAAKRQSLSELGDACDRAKAAADPDPDATHERNRKARCLRFWSKTGVAKLFGQTTPDQMAAIKAAVERRADELFHQASRSGAHEPRGAYLVDALEQICREWMGETCVEPKDAEPASTGTDSAARAAKKHSAAPIYLGLIRVDHAALMRGHVEGDELCEIVGLGPIPVRVARKLLGEAILHLVLTKGTAVGSTVNVKRGPNTAQRMALLWRSPLCSIDGCPVPRVEIDHTVPWVESQHTVLDELEPKCKHHHDLKTYKGWAVIHRDGKTFMVPPGDPDHPDTRPPP
jgi:hypothetical protein